jgi:hypothetical protein
MKTDIDLNINYLNVHDTYLYLSIAQILYSTEYGIKGIIHAKSDNVETVTEMYTSAVLVGVVVSLII